MRIAAGAVVDLDGIQGDRLELKARFAWQGAEEFGLKVRCAPGGEEETLIRIMASDWQSHREPQHQRRRNVELILDASRSSTSPEVSDRGSQRCTLEVDDDGLMELRVFVDRSVVEVFAAGQHYLAKRVYPARGDSMGVQVYAHGDAATLRTLEVWQMGPIWPIEE